MSGTVISLFDHSTEAVRPYAENGFTCYCFDILHDEFRQDGNIHLIPADLDPGASGWFTVRSVMSRATGKKVLYAWPPCDDLTSSSARHFKKKFSNDPLFQQRAVRRATLAAEVAEEYGFAWHVENPIGRLCTLWRKPDHYWDPCDFGGYLDDEEEHPVWPKYIAPRDAYTKGTGSWIGGGFVFPERKRVEPEILERVTKSGRKIRGSRQFMRLGGKSMKTKQIRNLTPRGASKAFFLANAA